jgi:hypothetical protein
LIARSEPGVACGADRVARRHEKGDTDARRRQNFHALPPRCSAVVQDNMGRFGMEYT